MITGITIGEIRIPVTSRRSGIAGLESPSAPTVPSTVARRAAATPIPRLLTSARDQRTSSTSASYQRSDQASGSSRSIPSVKVK